MPTSHPNALRLSDEATAPRRPLRELPRLQGAQPASPPWRRDAFGGEARRPGALRPEGGAVSLAG